jgi:glucose-6-phosphate isomerase
MSRVLARAADIEPAGFEDVVFIAVAEANMAVDAILRLPGPKLGKRTLLLDTVDPDALHALEEQLRLERTLFICASKSGKSIETHSLLLYFLQKLKLLGVESPGRHFVALAEDDSYLAQLARSYSFIDAFFDPPGILGRFSALIHFNFFLAAVGHFEPEDLLARANSMREACGPSAGEGGNPALSLAALLAAGELEGMHRLVVLGPKSLEPFVFRIARLLGASTAKDGRGILPIVAPASCVFEVLRRKTLVVILKMGNEEQGELDRTREQLRATNVPHVTIELNGPENLAAESFKWEIATALACVQLGLNPFDDREVRESRAKTSQILDRITTGQHVPSTTVRVRESDVELFAEGETRQQISTLNMTEALPSFLSLRHPDGYLVVIPFLQLSADVHEKLQSIRSRVESALGIPVKIVSSPRYLHGLAQACLRAVATGHGSCRIRVTWKE